MQGKKELEEEGYHDRESKDKKVNEEGKKMIELCEELDLIVLN